MPEAGRRGRSRVDEGWTGRQWVGLLSGVARAMGAGTPTEAGTAWTAPTTHPDPIVLGGGIPDGGTLPSADLRAALDRVLDTRAEEALRYGGVLGYDGLRDALAARQSRLEGVPLTRDHFIMNNGSAGGIDAVCAAFVEPGDTVLVESPTFAGSLRTMRGHGAKLVDVPMDDDGVSIESLAAALRQARADGDRVKLFYTIPDFHNPTGVLLAEQRRDALIDLCARERVLILEDSAYGEFNFCRERPRSLFAHAEGEGVIKVGTFSKIVATGLRVGWVQADPLAVDAVSRVRFDMGNSPLLHMALADYVASGKLDTHVEEMRALYARKCATLCASLTEHCRGLVRFVQPQGGFFLWVECLSASAQDVAREAALEGVVFPTGANFFQGGSAANDRHLRLAFSTATVEQLSQVGPRLRRAFGRLGK